jgi:hypothetical protein
LPAKKKIELINPKREPLTVEKLRELSGLNLSYEQAEETVESTRTFDRILYASVKKTQSAEDKKKSNYLKILPYYFSIISHKKRVVFRKLFTKPTEAEQRTGS